ncbi:MAG: B12-binding domain-containing radical SAM protein [Nanoarchaeota archaeon]
MIKNVLFIQPFEFFKKQLSNEILIWSIYLENFLKSKICDLNYDILYLPVEQKNENLNIEDLEIRENFKKEMNKLIEQIKFQIDDKCLISISGTTSNQFISSQMLGEFFQENYPSTYLVFGGAHASACPRDFYYKNSPMDYIIIGEGEVPLYKLISNNLKKQDDPKLIFGTLIEDLNELPPIDFELFHKYIDQFNHISISLSRGCPFSCRFCMEKDLSKRFKSLKRWRVYSPKRAINEIKTMIEYGIDNNINEFGFYDPIFGFKKKWLQKTLELFKLEEHKSIWLETRLDILNYELLKKLQSKKFYLMYGLETFSTNLLQIMNKTTNPRQYYDKFNELFEANQNLEYPYILNILFNHPGETPTSIHKTFDKITKLKSKDKNDILEYNIKLYSHFPGTYNYNNIKHLEKKIGTINYFPKWWKTLDTLKYGSFCIRPSTKLSLRKSLAIYFNRYKEFEKSKLKKDSKYFLKSIIIKKGIQKLSTMENGLVKFLDKNKIEMKGKMDF